VRWQANVRFGSTIAASLYLLNGGFRFLSPEKARSTRDLLNVLDVVATADTTTPHWRLMLVVLGGLAEFDREPIRARTGEGRRRAKARGVHLGRPDKAVVSGPAD
jgi:hypothetical protein